MRGAFEKCIKTSYTRRRFLFKSAYLFLRKSNSNLNSIFLHIKLTRASSRAILIANASYAFHQKI